MNWVELNIQPPVRLMWNGQRFGQRVFRIFNGPPSREAILANPGSIVDSTGFAFLPVPGPADAATYAPGSYWNGMFCDSIAVAVNGPVTDVVATYSSDAQVLKYAMSFQTEQVQVPYFAASQSIAPFSTSPASVAYAWTRQHMLVPMTIARLRVISYFSTNQIGADYTIGKAIRDYADQVNKLHNLTGSIALPGTSPLPNDVRSLWKFEGADCQSIAAYYIDGRVHHFVESALSWSKETGIVIEDGTHFAGAPDGSTAGGAWLGFQLTEAMVSPPLFGSRYETETGTVWKVPPYEQIVGVTKSQPFTAAEISGGTAPLPRFATTRRYQLDEDGHLQLPGIR